LVSLVLLLPEKGLRGHQAPRSSRRRDRKDQRAACPAPV